MIRFIKYYRFSNLSIYLHSKRIKKKAKIENESLKNKFIEYIKKKYINDRWFLNNFDIINYFLPKDMNKKFSYLEVGSYEGLSSLNILKFYKNANATFVDIWDLPNSNSKSLSSNFKKIEKRFDMNMKEFKSFKKIKQDSLVAIRNFIKINKKFNYIYIDGSHNGEDVISDAIEGFKILKNGGVMIFDDAMHPYNSSIKYQTYDGLYYFLKMFKKEIKILYFQNILIIKKN